MEGLQPVIVAGIPRPSVNWLEPVAIARGAEASWQDGTLRCRLDVLEPERDPRGWFARWLHPGSQAPSWNVSLRVVAPTRPEWHWTFLAHQRSFPCSSAYLFAPDAALLAERHGAVFELVGVLAREEGALVRAGHVQAPADVSVAGDLMALEASARRFVSWWLGAPNETQWMNARQAALGHPVVGGYSLRLAPMSTGALETTFHRYGDQFFVRTYGGCLTPRETWYGPYVERGAEFVAGEAARSTGAVPRA